MCAADGAAVFLGSGQRRPSSRTKLARSHSDETPIPVTAWTDREFRGLKRVRTEKFPVLWQDLSLRYLSVSIHPSELGCNPCCRARAAESRSQHERDFRVCES